MCGFTCQHFVTSRLVFRPCEFSIRRGVFGLANASMALALSVHNLRVYSVSVVLVPVGAQINVRPSRPSIGWHTCYCYCDHCNFPNIMAT